MAAHSHSVSASLPSSYAAPMGKLSSQPNTTSIFFYTSIAIIVSLLALEQAVYRYKKGPLPGPKWTIPIIGKFADSMNPTMSGYLKQWRSGALTALSVFNMYVFLMRFLAELLPTCASFIVMASKNEYSVKILNSPNHAEPCLVHSAKQILMPDNW